MFEAFSLSPTPYTLFMSSCLKSIGKCLQFATSLKMLRPKQLCQDCTNASPYAQLPSECSDLYGEQLGPCIPKRTGSMQKRMTSEYGSECLADE